MKLLTENVLKNRFVKAIYRKMNSEIFYIKIYTTLSL